MFKMLSVKCIHCSLRKNMRCVWSKSAEVPRITVPHKMVEKHKKAVLKATIKKAKSDRKFKGQAIISCKRKEFNHYKGQTYSNFNPQILASRGWKHSKSVGDYFTFNAFKGNPALEMKDEYLAHNFSQLGIEEQITEALKQYDIVKPTNIQAQAIPHLLQGKNMMCAAETGSGKTLTYLLPIIQRMIEYDKEFGANTYSNRPYGLIIVPSRELADQIDSVAEDLCRILGFHTYSQGGGRRTQKTLRERHKHKMDLLIATPGVLSKILTNRIYDLSRLSTLVLDEVDTLMDDSFNDLTLRIIKKINLTCNSFGTEPVRKSVDKPYDGEINYNIADSDDTSDVEEELTGLQVIMTGATFPRSLKEIAGEYLPLNSMVHIKTNSLHRLMPHISQKFSRVTPASKVEFFLKQVKQNIMNRIPTMVFCNRYSTVVFLRNILQESDIEPLCFHAKMTSQAREHRFKRFQEGENDILLCTDIASRGLDTTRVQHVINYDFPLFISDYIHRAGRVGRVGSLKPGFVLNFVTTKWDVDLLWQIETSARRATALHNVNANIKRKINYIVNEKFGPKDSNELTNQDEE